MQKSSSLSVLGLKLKWNQSQKREQQWKWLKKKVYCGLYKNTHLG